MKYDKKFRLGKPLEFCRVTQSFGVNYVDFYTKLGMKGHNGIDFRINREMPVLATHDGKVIRAGEQGGYGINVYLRTHDSLWDTVYGHLKDVTVKAGDDVKKGDVIGHADNTGKYTTGDHLHFGLRPVLFTANNGYNGWIDPEPFLESGWDKYPVDKFYGRKRNWLIEFQVRFKNSWLQRRLINKYKRIPPLLTGKEVNAIVYGGWGADEVLNETLKPIWFFLKKDEYKEGKKPPLRL